MSRVCSLRRRSDIPALPALPIDEVLSDVIDAVSAGPVVLVAPPGAGKTTRVPPTLVDRGEVEGQVWVVQPRRVAARAVARRIAAERGERVGDEVGYHVRFDRRVSDRSRIVAVTEGILLRKLQADPFLEGIGAVVFDEFHERRLGSDLALGLCRELVREVRDDLRLVVMSATMDPAPVATWLDARVVHSEGRAYPVTLERLLRPDDRADPAGIADLVAWGVRRALDEVGGRGDVLAFLPGVRTIQWTAERLADLPVEVVPLYGALSPVEQDRALRPGDGQRVVLATNLAETSLTVPGVRAVVDSGWAKVMHHDPTTGLDQLVTERISLASADQRSGRAGRVAEGWALRLWTEREERALAAALAPEVERLELAGTLLQLLAWGQAPAAFPWLQAPPDHHVAAGLDLLEQLGAVERGTITGRGRRLASLPLHPRLGRLLLEAHRLGHGAEGAQLAAWLSERGGGGRRREAGGHTPSDLVDGLQAFLSNGPRGARAAVRKVAERLQRAVARDPVTHADVGRDEALGRAVLAAWPDRVARRREPGSSRARMVGGKGVVQEGSSVRSELFVAVEVQPGGADAVVRQASAVDEAWLTTEERVVGQLVDGVVSARRVRTYCDLELASHPAPFDPDEAVHALVAWGEGHLDDVVPSDGSFPQLLARARLARRFDERVPAIDDDLLCTLLPVTCRGCRSLAQVRRADWVGALRDQLGWPVWQRIEALAPPRIRLPRGRSAAVDYLGERPVVRVRIQEVLGLVTTPRVGEGAEPVLLHLLAPNQRVQQITDDLEGFWRGSYRDVRKELRGRYPKHAWPEDPTAG